MSGLALWLRGTYQYRLLLLGSGFGGKTTFLYRLKQNEVVNTVPTIGFNMETVSYPADCEWTIVDSGGKYLSLPLSLPHSLYHLLNTCPDNNTAGTGRNSIQSWKSYHPKNTIVLFFHDITDSVFPDPAEFIHFYMQDMLEAGTNTMWIVVSKQDLLPPDKVGETLDRLRSMYEREMVRYEGRVNWRFVDRRLSGLTGEGVYEILDDVSAAFEKTKWAPRGKSLLGA